MIDAGQPGAGVTNWSFAWVGASNIVLEHHRRTAGTSARAKEIGIPDRDGETSQTHAYYDLGVAGMATHRALAEEIGPGDWWHPTGHLRWFDDPAQTEQLRGVVDHLQSWGYDVGLWDAERVRRLLEPDVRFPTDDTEVAFYRDEGWIDGHSLVARLIDATIESGAATNFGRAVIDIVVKGDRVTEVILAGDHRYRVDAVVNATGPAGGDIAAIVGRTLPMHDEPGLVARIRCDRVPIRRAMHAPHVELRPDRPGHVVLHSREIEALIDSAADMTDLSARLHRLAIDVAPALNASELIDARVVRRPIPIDGFPSVGGINDLGGYYEAITHGGITLGAIIGRLLAHEIIDGTVHELIEPYRPDRFVEIQTAPARA